MFTLARLSRVALAILVLLSIAAFSQEKPARGDQDHPQQRDQWFMRGRTVNGKPGAAELHRAWQQKMNMRAARARISAMRSAAADGTQNTVNSGGAALSITNTTTPNGAVWTPLGPAPALTAAPYPAQYYQSQDYGPAVGRVTTVVVDPADATGNTVYIGGATGGLWKSTNAADPTRDCTSSHSGSCVAPNVTWTPLIDSQPSLTVGAIALQPGNSSLIIVGTGEANSSADSYYGQGFLRSTDGGSTWSQITNATVNGTSTDLTGIGFLKIAFNPDNPNIVVAAGASSSVGPQTGAQQSSDNRLGLYYSLDAGATWTRAFVTEGNGTVPDPGSVTDVIYNHTAGRFFAALRFHGIYSSSDGVNWVRVTNQPPPALTNCTATLNRSCNFYRAALAIVPGRNEMYAFVVDANDGDRGIYQTLDSGSTWTAISTSGMVNCGDGSNNGCDTDQGSYNLTIAAIPNGSGTDLYTGAINEFKCSITSANPTCAAAVAPFINLTHVYGCKDIATGNYLLTLGHVHPDQHGIAFVSDATHPIYFGNDGGIYRVLDGTTLNSGTCPTVPTASQFDNLDSNMGAMLQFVSFSQHPTDDTILFGGTQDNGTPKKDSSAPMNSSGYGYLWGTTHIGDGGFSDLNPVNNDWFASYAGLFIQRCPGATYPEGTCIDYDYPPDSTEINSTKVAGDAATFYPVYMLDPASLGTSSAATQMVLGTCRIWRGNSDGSAGLSGNSGWSPGFPLSNNFDTNSNSVCSSSAVNFISALAVGGPKSTANAQFPNGVSTVIYAGTEGFPVSASGGIGSGGQLFVTFSADTDVVPGTSTAVGPGPGWANITAPGAGACTATASACNINPYSYNISGVAMDPSDATGQTAYVTVMGFHVAHVLKTTNGGLTWAVLDGDPKNGGLPDAPADSVVVHPFIPGQIYVGTDVGVFVYTPGPNIWNEVAPPSGSGFLPNVAVTKVAIFNSSGILKLRASTYGRGIWETPLAGKDFLVSVSSASVTAYPGQSATFNGTITYFNGYNSSITISCQGMKPATCNTGAQPLSIGATSFSVTVTNPASGNFTFSIQAAGSDGTTHSIPVTFHSADFSIGAPNPASLSLANGHSSFFSFNVTATAPLPAAINYTCTSSDTVHGPVSCTFVTTGGPTTFNNGVTLTAGPFATAGTYTITITGATADGQLSHNASMPITLTVTTNKTFEFVQPAPLLPQITSGQKAAPVALVVGSQDGFAGDVSFTCSQATLCSLSTSPSGPPASPVTLTLTSGGQATLYVTLDATQGGGGFGNLTVVGNTSAPADQSVNSISLPYAIADFGVSATPGLLFAFPTGSAIQGFQISSSGNYNGAVTATCTADPGLTCTPASTPFSLSGNGSASLSETIAVSSGATATDKTFTVSVTDGKLTRTATGTIRVQDFTLSADPSSATIKAGIASTHRLILTGLNGLGSFGPLSNVTLSISGCNATALMICTLSQNTISVSSTPGTVTLTIATIAPSAALGAPPLRRPGSPLFAFWLGLPAIALGFVGAGSAGCGAGAPPDSRGRLSPPRKRRGWMLLAISAFVLLMVLAACGGGGGGSSSTPPPTPQPGTPAGSYTITVTATLGSGSNMVTHTQTINLTVQ